jgi:hypothetical protein
MRGSEQGAGIRPLQAGPEHIGANDSWTVMRLPRLAAAPSPMNGATSARVPKLKITIFMRLLRTDSAVAGAQIPAVQAAAEVDDDVRVFGQKRSGPGVELFRPENHGDSVARTHPEFPEVVLDAFHDVLGGGVAEDGIGSAVVQCLGVQGAEKRRLCTCQQHLLAHDSKLHFFHKSMK